MLKIKFCFINMMPIAAAFEDGKNTNLTKNLTVYFIYKIINTSYLISSSSCSDRSFGMCTVSTCNSNSSKASTLTLQFGHWHLNT